MLCLYKSQIKTKWWITYTAELERFNSNFQSLIMSRIIQSCAPRLILHRVISLPQMQRCKPIYSMANIQLSARFLSSPSPELNHSHFFRITNGKAKFHSNFSQEFLLFGKNTCVKMQSKFYDFKSWIKTDNDF